MGLEGERKRVRQMGILSGGDAVEKRLEAGGAKD